MSMSCRFSSCRFRAEFFLHTVQNTDYIEKLFAHNLYAASSTPHVFKIYRLVMPHLAFFTLLMIVK